MRLIPALLLLALILGACQSERQSQALADAQAGNAAIGQAVSGLLIQIDTAVRDSIDPRWMVLREAMSAIPAILAGQSGHLSAIAAGETIPPPSLTPAEILDDAGRYQAQGQTAQKAAEVAAASPWWHAILAPAGTIAAMLAALAAGRLLPGRAGEAVANMAWAVLAPQRAKDRDQEPVEKAAILQDENNALRAQVVALRSALEAADRVSSTSAVEPRPVRQKSRTRSS